jgi:hypothetical protein
VSRLLAIVLLLLAGCEDTRRLDAGARDASREGSARSDAVTERSPTDSLREPRPVDALHEAGASDAGIFGCAALLGSASVQGQVAGQPFAAAGALAASRGGAAPPAVILLVSRGTVCAGVHASDVLLELGLCQAAPGSTAIGQLCANGSQAFARLAASLGGKAAATGTIILESFGASCGGKSKGSFVLAFPDQGGPALLSGSFDATGCGVLP